ncbi:MAG: DUF2993 domain-containing protein [Cyanobacteria bacterium P01_A01_bin.114]
MIGLMNRDRTMSIDEKAESVQVDTPVPKGSRLIGKVLPMAVRLWLNTQVEHIEGLVFQLDGTDRQILSGHIPGVALAAKQAIYQGIYLSQIRLSAQEVRINLGQVIRGKPLQLLRSFLLSGEVKLTEADLNASLKSELLSEGMCTFWQTLLAMSAVDQELSEFYHRSAQTIQLTQCQSTVCIGERALTLSLLPGRPVSSINPLEINPLDRSSDSPPMGQPMEQPIILKAGLSVESGRLLQLHHPQWLTQSGQATGYLSQALAGFQWDLGSATRLQTLAIETGLLRCEGAVVVNP